MSFVPHFSRDNTLVFQLCQILLRRKTVRLNAIMQNPIMLIGHYTEKALSRIPNKLISLDVEEYFLDLIRHNENTKKSGERDFRIRIMILELEPPPDFSIFCIFSI